MGHRRDRDATLSRYIRSTTGIPHLDYVKRDTGPVLRTDGVEFIIGTSHGRPTWISALSLLPEDGIASVVRYSHRIAGSPGDALVVTRLRNYVPLVEVWANVNKDRLIEAEKGRE